MAKEDTQKEHSRILGSCGALEDAGVSVDWRFRGSCGSQQLPAEVVILSLRDSEE